VYNPFSLQGKTILVTGASSGIGRETAIVCSKMGAKVVVTGRNNTRLDETYSSLEGSDHVKILADLSQNAEIEMLAEKVPQLDGFSSNAGITKVVLVKHIKQSILNDILTTNTIAPIVLTQLLLKKGDVMGGSAIVFTSSLSVGYYFH